MKLTNKQIGEIAKEVNNDVRAYFNQEPSLQPVSEQVVEKVMSKPLDPEKNHEKWREDRIAQGWTGGEYDQEKKTHPNLSCSGYTALPFEEKVKDFTFYAVLEALRLANEKLEE